MATRYYLPDGLSQKERDKLRQKFVCMECGEMVTYWLDREKGATYLACHRHNINGHDGVATEFIPPSEQINTGRRESMSEENVKQDRALVAKGIPLTGVITEKSSYAYVIK